MLKITLRSCAEQGDDAKVMTNTGKDQSPAIKLRARPDGGELFWRGWQESESVPAACRGVPLFV